MDIKPSTKLKVVSVSKLKTLSCLRKYFWKYILNLETRKINTNFWFGGVLGAGFESLLLGESDTKIKLAMKKEDKKRVSGQILDGSDMDELRLQRRLIEAMVFGAAKRPEVKRMKLSKSQIMFRHKLPCGVLFCGTEDGEGMYKKKKHLFEIKTTSRVTSSYLDSLRYGKQVNGYAYAMKKLRKSTPSECLCCIFHKPQKQLKKGQTHDEFVDEIKADISGGVYKGKKMKARPEMYYVWDSFTLGSATVRGTGKDIEREAYILKLLYEDCGSKLLDMNKWPKQENKCFDYRGCEYQMLCKQPVNWKLYLRFYQQRKPLYSEEMEELDD